MIKITTDVNQIYSINNTVKFRLYLPTINQYCDVQKHPTEKKWAIPLQRIDILNQCKPFCEFITDNWLNTNIIEYLSSDWYWLFLDEPIRLIIPTNLIAWSLNENNDLAQIIIYAMGNIDKKYRIADQNSGETIIYLKFLLLEHKTILEQYNKIKIENL